MDPENDTKMTLLGGRGWLLFWTPGPLLGHFVAILLPLGPRGPKGRPKSSLREAKSCPREAKRGPGEAKREPKVP